jgi:hypothetical protein
MKNILLAILFIPMFLFGQEKIFNNQDLEISLKIHNLERAQLGLSKLEWSKNLQKDAERYAKYLAKKDVFKHSSNKNQGENLYYEFNSESITTKPFSRATSSWLDEKSDYQYAKIGDGKNTFHLIGHYTQMIWRSTIKVGLGAYVNSKGKVYVVARYYPAGNITGNYPY